MHDTQFNREFFCTRPISRNRKFVFLKHGLLFLLTFFTATIAGSIYPFGPLQIFADTSNAELSYGLWDYVYFPIYYAQFVIELIKVIFADYELLKTGISFSASLLFILLTHEAGHYFACRLYGVSASLPYFIPVPPLIGPAGTLGAFIRIRPRIPSRTATFDIGVAGPIAGFIALIPVATLGIIQMKYNPNVHASSVDLTFSDPLLMVFLAKMVGVDLSSLGYMKMNSFYAAAWLGLLVTALNLMPVGQLDGGHATYALFGRRLHFIIGLLAFIFMLTIALTGLIFFNSPSGIVFSILMGFMLILPHPRPIDETPLDLKRKLIGLFVLLIFVLSFVPFPIHIHQ